MLRPQWRRPMHSSTPWGLYRRTTAVRALGARVGELGAGVRSVGDGPDIPLLDEIRWAAEKEIVDQGGGLARGRGPRHPCPPAL